MKSNKLYLDHSRQDCVEATDLKIEHIWHPIVLKCKVTGDQPPVLWILYRSDRDPLWANYLIGQCLDLVWRKSRPGSPMANTIPAEKLGGVISEGPWSADSGSGPEHRGTSLERPEELCNVNPRGLEAPVKGLNTVNVM